MSGKLKDLLARIERAAEGSRELDCLVAIHVERRWIDETVMPFLLEQASRETGGVGGRFEPDPDRIEADEWGVAPATTSVDAALSLVNKLLPKEWPFILNSAREELARRYAWHMAFARPGQLEALPLAIVGSLLKALIATDPASHPHTVTRQGEKP